MTSLWLDRSRLTPQQTLDSEDLSFDYVVVGAGLTGLVTALLLARGGAEVAVVEARSIGAAATGNTTAKLSLLQGTRLSEISSKHSAATTQHYVDANEEGQQWLLRYCEAHEIPVQRETAYTYANTAAGADSVRAELNACASAGLNVEWTDELPELPFPTHGAVRLDNQAQFDPMSVLEGLATDLLERGVQIFENTRVQSVSRRNGGQSVETEHGSVHAKKVVLATGTPILDRGGYFARLEPERSYALAFTVPGSIPRGMYLSADKPSRSLRYAPGNGEDLLLVGGNGHPVGRSDSPATLVEDIVEWTQTHFSGAQLTHSWSAQDYTAIDELPYVGTLLPGLDSILVATGYAKWGMTNAVAAALALASREFGGQLAWADAMRSWRPSQLVGLPKAAQANAGVGLNMATGWLRAALSTESSPPTEGSGHVDRSGIRPVATCTVDGVTKRVSAVCPHLYGIVKWNDAERSWDCPLHGSRFDSDGTVLEGPVTSNLQALPPG